jgi:hypothetical protein
MNLLESLRSEVKVKQAEQARSLAQHEREQEYYRDTLRPVMLKAKVYLSEVVDCLRFLDSHMPVELPLSPDNKSMVSMDQKGYELFYDDSVNPTHLELVFDCDLVRSQNFHLPTRGEVERYTEYLDSLDFPYHRKTQLDRQYEISSANFKLEGPLKVRIGIVASPADRCIYIHLRNLEATPRKRYKFSAERVDTALLDRLSRLILRQETDLVTVELCPETRQRLRNQVENGRRERLEDLKNAFEERRLAQLAEREKTLSARVLKVLAS